MVTNHTAFSRSSVSSSKEPLVSALASAAACRRYTRLARSAFAIRPIPNHTRHAPRGLRRHYPRALFWTAPIYPAMCTCRLRSGLSTVANDTLSAQETGSLRDGPCSRSGARQASVPPFLYRPF
ncbi:cytochrome P450 [Ilyonectria robusta]